MVDGKKTFAKDIRASPTQKKIEVENSQSIRRKNQKLLDALNFDSDFSVDGFELQINEKSLNINPNDSLLLMSFRLPLMVRRSKEGKLALIDSNSPIYPSIFKIRNMIKHFKWIGWPGIIPKNEEEKIAISCMLQRQNCEPIFLDKNLMILYQLFID